MFRFIDLRHHAEDISGADDGTPTFAFYDTVMCRFVDLDGDHVFDSISEVLACSTHDLELQQRCLALLPDWVPE